MNDVFVVRGDIAHFACGAWLLPTDARLQIESGWGNPTELRRRAQRTLLDRFGTDDLAFALPEADGEPVPVATAVPLGGISSTKELVPPLRALFTAAADREVINGPLRALGDDR